MRKHRDEMIRFANREEGTEVWYKHGSMTEWNKSDAPRWSNDTTYVVDDEYAELRKESIDTGRPIQVSSDNGTGWITITQPTYIKFILPLEDYRLEPEEFEYPIYKKARSDGSIVKFTGLKEGVIVQKDIALMYPLGYTSDDWVEHTNTDEWEDYEYQEPTYYYKWEKLFNDGNIWSTNWMTDEYAERGGFKALGWRKIENSKRTWEETK